MTALNIVLSGATGGIGRAMALDFANAGHSLILLGRNTDALTSLRNSLVQPERHLAISRTTPWSTCCS